MIECAIDYDYLTRTETEQLLKVVKNQKHKLICMLLLDTGLRISECISLKYENFDFKNQMLYVRSLKKREKEEYRKIPISQRLFFELTNYISNQSDIKKENYLFPSGENHISRFMVNKFMERLIKKHNITDNLHPHALRHTFATNLVAAGAPLENVKTMLGHADYNTTLLYAHIPDKVLRQNIDIVEYKNKSFANRLKEFFYKRKPIRVNLAMQKNFVIGRHSEFKKLTSLVEKNVNVLILGGVGVGKSVLIDNLQTNKKRLVFDDISNLKQSLINMLVYLYKNDKEKVFALLYDDFDLDAFEQKMSRESIPNLCEEVKKICVAYEYVLIIRSIDKITPKAITVLESFKSHFVIVTSAREIPLDKTSFVWNFEKIELQNLTRPEAYDLIQKLSSPLEIEDFELFKNHIFEQSDGNPRAISELVERYSKEPLINVETIRSITHQGALKEIDMSFFVLLFIASIAIMRYLTGELENPAFRLLGGVAMIALLFSRTIFARTKRKFL